MDNRKKVEYFEELNKIQGVLSEELNKFFENIIIYYKGWKKYPRKIKKLLKKSFIWSLKDCNIEDIKILVR